MKIACVMVTEDRAPIWGIGLSSFLSQHHVDRHLIVVLPGDEEKAYQVAATGFNSHPYMDRVHYIPLFGGARTNVPQRLDMGCQSAFAFGADLVAIWDDDDWSPVDRLDKTAGQPWSDLPGYASYTQGWFVNLRTLRGELIRPLPSHLWGGTLAFNKAAWDRAGGFCDKPMSGYDRAFQKAVKKSPESKEYRLQRGMGEPVAFSHMKNVATWLRSKGTPMGGVLASWMPEIVLNEIKRCQRLMVDTNTYPPQPEA